jgi:DNA (cytosine-5)-methyltransferase 1
MVTYYNETDPFAALWLRTLITQGHIPRGDVDERNIADAKPHDFRPYTQCHFFSGIGVWAYALRLTGWDDDRPVWTGSCPCQPFNAAGKGADFADERDLWPAWFNLTEHAKPRNVTAFDEQVASKHGLAWLDLVHTDMEGAATPSGRLISALWALARRISDKDYGSWPTPEASDMTGGEQAKRVMNPERSNGLNHFALLACWLNEVDAL